MNTKQRKEVGVNFLYLMENPESRGGKHKHAHETEIPEEFGHTGKLMLYAHHIYGCNTGDLFGRPKLTH